MTSSPYRPTAARLHRAGRQSLFFAGTAAPEGRVNISPRGLDNLRLLEPAQVAWLNITGSSNKTAAHLRPDPRMTLMFCAFEGAPLILRLYDAARIVQPDDSAQWAFPPLPSARQVYGLDIDLVQTSCGMAVPLMDFQAESDDLNHWATQKGPDGLKAGQQLKNRTSIDGFHTDSVCSVITPEQNWCANSTSGTRFLPPRSARVNSYFITD